MKITRSKKPVIAYTRHVYPYYEEVNMNKKRFKQDYFNVGDSVYFKNDNNKVKGQIQDLLHDNTCMVLWADSIEPEVCNINDLIRAEKQEAFYDAYDSITSSTDYNATYKVRYRSQNYLVHYTIADYDDLFHTYSAQVTEIHPYDDAEYWWAKIDTGTIEYIYRGKVKDSEYYLTPEDEDVEDDEYCDVISDRAIKKLYELNKDITPRMIHSSEYTWDEDVEDEATENEDITKNETEYETSKFNEIGTQSEETTDILSDNEVELTNSKEESEHIEFDNSINITLNDVLIEVFNDETYNYMDTDYTFADNPDTHNGDWEIDISGVNYNITNTHGSFIDDVLRDKVSVVEDFDTLIEPIIPKFAGTYVLNGDVEMFYNVDGTLWQISEEDTPEYEFELNNVDFDEKESKSKCNVSLSEYTK